MGRRRKVLKENMFKIIIICFVIIFSFLSLQAADVSGTIDGDTWTVENSPYNVVNHIFVNDLTIEPGVKVFFSGNFSFTVNGILNASGTQTDSIIFKPSAGNSSGWQGIIFNSGLAEHEMDYCSVSGSSTNGIIINSDNVTITRTSSNNHAESGLYVNNQTVTLTKCTFNHNSSYGINLISNANVTLYAVRISFNESYGINLPTGSLTAYNCIIDHNNGYGLYTNDGEYNLENVVVAANTSHGLVSLGGTINIINSIFYYNEEEPAIFASSGTILTTYSNIEDGFEGIGNINVSNAFIDQDYYLRDTSSCIDGGNPYFQYDDKYFPPSKGGDENDMGAYGGPNARKWFSPLSTDYVTIDFSSVNYDEYKTELVTIKNYHDNSLEIDSISIKGSDKSKFEVMNLPSSFPIALDIDESMQFSVRFSPGDKGDFFANLFFYSVIENQTIKLTGKGVRPNIIINPKDNNFGEIDVGDSSFSNLVILNSSYGSLKVHSIEGPFQSVYNTDFIPFELGFMQSETLSVRFKPISADTSNDSLFILSNDPDESRSKVSLFGIGMAPEITADQDNIDFEEIDVFTSKPYKIIINNTGNKDLIVTKAFLSGPDTDQFNLITEIDSDSLLIPDASMDVDLEFVPNIRADLSSTLNITSNDPNTDTLKIPLQGKSVAADLTISRENIDFGNIHLPMDSELTVEIGNAGERKLTVDTLYFEDSEDSVFTLIDSNTYFNIDEGEDPQSIRIKFTPADDITYYDRLVIVSNDYLDDTLRIEVTGRGVTPHIAYGTNFLGFNDVWLGESLILTKIINNEGSADLIVKNIQITGVNASRFMIDDKSDSLIIQPDASDSIQIRYSPNTLGIDTAHLQLTCNDLNNTNIIIDLSGRGVAAYISSNKTILDFGNVKSDTTVYRSFKVENTGNTNLEIQELIITSNRYDAFQIVNDVLPIIVTPKSESEEISVLFQTENRLVSDAVLNIISNAYQQDTLKINLEAISNVAKVPYFYLFSDSVNNIGNAVITDTLFYPLNISNRSDDTPLTVDSLIISGVNSDIFYIDSNRIAFNILPMEMSNCRTLSFIPKELGSYSVQLKIYSNDSISSPNTYAIFATGIKDQTPPLIMIDTSVTQLILNTNGKFQTRIWDQESTIKEAKLFIRKTHNVVYDSLVLESTNHLDWSADLNSDLITEYGVEYYLRIKHGGIESFYPITYETRPEALSVEIPAFNFPMSTLANDYQMISVPFNSKGQTLADLFGDELGSYDNTKYRIFDWDNAREEFEEQDEMNALLPPGKALYLITKKSKQLNINNCQTVLTDETFTIDLKAGWNMISIPYAFNILWSDIHESPNGTDLVYWNGTQMTYPDTLEPFKGYGFHANTDTILVIPAKRIGTVPVAKQYDKLSEGEWYFQIEAQRGRYADQYNFAGVRHSSHDKIDHWDSYEAPGIGDYISLFFTENTDDNNQIKLCADYKNKNNEFYQFDFEYKSTFSGKTLLNLVAKNLPDTYDWVVITREGEVILPKGEISSSQHDKQYRLIVGNYEYLNSIKSEFNTLPDKFSVSQNYPNPFNPVTKITIAMPKEAYITADIYNVLGERIKRIANNVLLSEGYHDFSWDGKNEKNFLVSSGIYFFTFRTQNHVKTIKMILQR